MGRDFTAPTLMADPNASGEHPTAARNGGPANLHSHQAERALVSMCLLSAQACETAYPMVQAADMSHPAYRTVYAVIMGLHSQQLEITGVQVLEQLRSEGTLDGIGGEQAILALSKEIPGSDVRPFARTVQDYALRRRMYAASSQLRSMVEDPALSVTDLVNQMNKIAASIALPNELGYGRTLQSLLATPDEPYDWVIPGLMERRDRTVVIAPEGKGKALGVTTAVPLYYGGWSDMGDLEVGDIIIGSGNQPTSVIAVSPIMLDRVCVLIEFTDGTDLVADWDHNWVLWSPDRCRQCTTGDMMVNRHVTSFTLPHPEDSALRGPRVTNMQIVPAEPVRCVQVQAADGLFRVGKGDVLTHNSTLLRQIAVMAAAGIHPFDPTERIEPVRTLIVDLENRERQVRRRLSHIADAASYEIGGDTSWAEQRCFLWVEAAGINLRDRVDVGRLVATVRQTKPDLITIGPLYKMANGDPKDEEVAKSIADVLDLIANRYNTALLIEGHAPHSTNATGDRTMRPFGASLWMRWPEFGLGLAPRADGGMDVQHWRGAREERSWPTQLTRGRNWHWEVPPKINPTAADDPDNPDTLTYQVSDPRDEF